MWWQCFLILRSRKVSFLWWSYLRWTDCIKSYVCKNDIYQVVFLWAYWYLRIPNTFPRKLLKIPFLPLVQDTFFVSYVVDRPPPQNHGRANTLVQGRGSVTVRSIPSVQCRDWPTDTWGDGLAWGDLVFWGGWRTKATALFFLAKIKAKIKGQRC